MNHLLGFIVKVRVILLLVVMACPPGAFAQQAGKASIFRIEKTAPLLQTDKVQLELVKARCDRQDRFNRNAMILFSLLFSFGAMCAIWAQNDYRNSAFWFLAGFAFNIMAVFAILYIKRRNRHRKRYRRIISYLG